MSVLPKNTSQCPRPGLESGLLVPGTSTLTTRPPRLPVYILTVLVIYTQIVMSSGKHAYLHVGKHAYPGLSLRAVTCSACYS